MSDRVQVLHGDCRELLRTLPDESVHCVVTSPPYWNQRDYEGGPDQLGLEVSPELYVARLVDVFREVRRVLRSDGTCWVNLGDSYIAGRTGGIGSKSTITSKRNHKAAMAGWEATGGHTHRHVDGLGPKNLVGIPWRVAFALQADGWILRTEIIWHKPNPMPESVRDRPSRAHEYLFLLAKSERYFYDADAIRTPIADKTRSTYGSVRRVRGGAGSNRLAPAADRLAETIPKRQPKLAADGTPLGANRRSVWTIASRPYDGAHYSVYPTALVEPCVAAGCPVDGVVLDPFAGSGTTLEVALRMGRRAIGIEINPRFLPLIEERLRELQYPLIAAEGAV